MSVIGNIEINFSEEQGMILDTAREFCRDKSPVSAVRAQLDSRSGYNRDTWDAMTELGWLGISLPQACGGSQLGVSAVVPVVECMGRALLSTPFISTTLAAQLISRAGSAEQVERLLPEIIQGKPATLALLEDDDWGSSSVACHLDERGKLQGMKKHVADAGAADFMLVSILHEGAPALAVVHKEQLGGNRIIENTLIDETKRAARVDLSAIEIAPENLISGSKVTTALSDIKLLGALLIAAEAAGSAAACLDTIVDYLKTRKQFGKLIGSYQALKHPTVEILTGVDSSRSFVYHAASLVGDDSLSEDAEVACRMAKVQAADTLLFAGDRAVQFHGGMGFTYECDAQLYIRRAQWSQQQFGDAQHHRKRLADALLKPTQAVGIGP